MDLPSNVGYGTVYAEFLRQVADTTDPGREPDAVPMAGLNITFTPTVTGNVARNPNAGKIIILESVSCTTDANGVMVGPDGDPGIVLIATDDEDLDPHGWTWKATITGTGLPVPLSFTFALPVGANVNLATVIPVPGSPGVSIADGLIRSVMVGTLVDGSGQPFSVSAGKLIIPSGYTPPIGGIPKNDLATVIQTSLDKADAAVQAGASTVFTGDTTFAVAPAVPDSAFTIAKTSGLQAALNDRELATNKGVANGYASLDSGGKIPAGQLGSTLMAYQGTWNASTNTPTLVDGVGTAGHVYRVATAGTRNLGGGSQTFNVGDDVIYSGTAWQGSANPSAVVSVAGKTGAVTLAKGDVGLPLADNTADADKPVSTAQANAIGLKANDNAVVKLTGNQTKVGVLTLTDGVVVPDASIPQVKVTGLVEDLSERLTSGMIVEGTGVDITELAGGLVQISAPGTTGPAGATGDPGAVWAFHGSNASYPRPLTTAPVIWIGTVQPNNAVASKDVYGNYTGPINPPAVDTAGLVNHWIASDLMLADNTSVASWPSRVGGVAFTATGTAQPTYRATSLVGGVANGKPCVLLDGIDDFMDAATGILAQPSTVIVIARIVAVPAGSSRVIVGTTNATTNRNSLGISSGGNMLAFGGANRTGNPANTSLHIHAAIFNNTVGNMRTDGASSQNTIGTESGENRRLGGNFGNTAFANVEIYEVLVYNKALTGAEYGAIRTARTEWYGLP